MAGMIQAPSMWSRPRVISRRRLSAATRWAARVVLGGAAVAQAAVAAHEPGDAAFDHRPVLPVDGVEGAVFRLAAGGAQQRSCSCRVSFRPVLRRWCSGPAAGSRGRSRRSRRRRLRVISHGVPGRAGDRAGGLVDGEVVEGEPAGDGGRSGDRLDHRIVPGIGQARRAVRAGAVGRVAEHLQAGLGSPASSLDADGGFVVVRCRGRGQLRSR